MVRIVPSILSADFAHLAQEIATVEPFVEWLHIDVMDGHFVPNLTIGPNVIHSLRKVSNLEFDVHLMIRNPHKLIDKFIDAGADMITFHLEAEKKERIPGLIKRIHSRGIKAGISIKPSTPASKLLPYVENIDLVLCMTVEPGFGGQAILPETFVKIEKLSQIISDSKRPAILQVDGGINKTTAPQVVAVGASVLVVGSAIFRQKDRASAINEILRAVGSPSIV